MAIEVRRDHEVHRADGGWSQAPCHFSFGQYRDLEHMGAGALQVLADDRLEPGPVWPPMHPHRDIESCTYVVEGRFTRRDRRRGR